METFISFFYKMRAVGRSTWTRIKTVGWYLNF